MNDTVNIKEAAVNIGRKKSNKIKKGTDDIIVNLVGGLILLIFAVMAVLPFLMIFTGSISEERDIISNGYSIFPRKISFDAYKYLFNNPKQIINGYKVTLLLVTVGTFLTLNIITMTSYVLYRKDFRARNALSFFFYFTTLFNGGMIATYIFMIRYLGLKDNIIALFLPHMFNVFYMIVMRSFITTTVPISLVESAKLDGANDLQIYFKVVFPLLKTALASVGLFIFLGYWNDWYNCMLYITSQEKMSLQYILYKTLSESANYERAAMASGVVLNGRMPSETMKLAMTVVITLPIMFAYPFVQKYFVKGITVGSVKG